MMEKNISKTNSHFKSIYRFLAIFFLVVSVLRLLPVFKFGNLTENFKIALTMYQGFYIGFICAIALLDKNKLKLL